MTTCPLARKRKQEASVTAEEPAAKVLKQEMKDENEGDTVLLKEVSDIPCDLVRVKEEPITEDDSVVFKGPDTIVLAPLQIKDEANTSVNEEAKNETNKENEIEALRRIEQECARIQRENSENTTSAVDSEMDTILSPVAIQLQVQNIIHGESLNIIHRDSEERGNFSKPESQISHIVDRGRLNQETVVAESENINGTGTDKQGFITLSDSNEKSNEPRPGVSSGSSSGVSKVNEGSHIIVKQELNDDSDEEMDDSGEYMVLAEWTDGKLEEAGTTVADKENDKEKDQAVAKCKYLWH